MFGRFYKGGDGHAAGDPNSGRSLIMGQKWGGPREVLIDVVWRTAPSQIRTAILVGAKQRAKVKKRTTRRQSSDVQFRDGAEYRRLRRRLGDYRRLRRIHMGFGWGALDAKNDRRWPGSLLQCFGGSRMLCRPSRRTLPFLQELKECHSAPCDSDVLATEFRNRNNAIRWIRKTPPIRWHL